MTRSRPIRPALLALAALLAGAPCAAAAEFPAVVRSILTSQTTGPLSSMSPSTKAAMIDCVIGALVGVPEGQKRYVASGASLDEQQHRFGEVVMANHAQWKQAIARACASIALQKSTK